MIGRNLSINDSFTIKFQNKTSTSYTFNLFNQGGGGASQTVLVTQNVRSSYNFFSSDLSAGGIFLNPTTFNVRDALGNIIATANMLAGQTIVILAAAINPITDLQGNSGEMYIQVNPNSLTGKEYDLVFTLDTVVSFEFTAAAQQGLPSLSLVSYVSNNAFIFIEGVVPITVIQQSETGNSYRIMGVDIISNNANQLLEELNYGNKSTDGNRWSASFTPVIDPYQENSTSLHAIGGGSGMGSPVDDFTINTDTTFSYTVLSTTYSRLTFNYVRASEASMKEFNQALASELVMRFNEKKKYLDSLKFRKAIFLQ